VSEGHGGRSRRTDDDGIVTKRGCDTHPVGKKPKQASIGGSDGTYIAAGPAVAGSV
jgi:hypothetical protein